jgi:hypothetical protein
VFNKFQRGFYCLTPEKRTYGRFRRQAVFVMVVIARFLNKV